MQGQYLQHGSSTPTARLFFYNTSDGTPATVLFNAASLALVYARDNGANVALTLVTATLGTWVANGFISRGGGVHDLYLPTAAALTGAKSLTITSTGLPTGVSMNPCIIPLGADDIAIAAATDTTVASAVRTNLTVELARIDVAVSSVSGGGGGGGPSAATISTQVNTDLAGAIGAAARAAIALSVEAQILDNFAAIPLAPTTAAIAAALPTNGSIAAAVEASLLDNFAAIPAAPSAAANAAAVESALLDNFAAIPAAPTAASVSTQVMSDLAGAGGAAAREAVADSFLGRAIAGAANGGRTVRDAFRFLRNRVSRNVGTGLVTVTTEDDSTTAWTTQTTSSTAAAPIITSDPT